MAGSSHFTVMKNIFVTEFKTFRENSIDSSVVNWLCIRSLKVSVDPLSSTWLSFVPLKLFCDDTANGMLHYRISRVHN